MTSMPFFRRRQKDQIDLESRSEKLGGLKYKDLLVLEQLVKAGADLSQPRHVLHYLYFPDQDRAGLAAEEAATRGFEVTVREPLPDYPEQWTVVCERHDVVLDPEHVRDTTDSFETLASSYAGDYDGWEASV